MIDWDPRYVNQLRRLVFNQRVNIDRLDTGLNRKKEHYSKRKDKHLRQIHKLRARVAELENLIDASSVARTEKLQRTLELTQTELEQMKTQNTELEQKYQDLFSKYESVGRVHAKLCVKYTDAKAQLQLSR